MDEVLVQSLLEQGIGYREIERRIGEPAQSIRSFANRLRSQGIRIIVGRSPWTEREDSIGRQCMTEGQHPEEIVSLLPGHSLGAVIERFYRVWKPELSVRCYNE